MPVPLLLAGGALAGAALIPGCAHFVPIEDDHDACDDQPLPLGRRDADEAPPERAEHASP